MEEFEASHKPSLLPDSEPAVAASNRPSTPGINSISLSPNWLRTIWKIAKRISPLALVGFLGWLFANRPLVLIESQAPLNPKEVHGSVIVIKNAGQLWASSVTATCVIREIEYDSGHQMDMWGIYLHVQPCST